MSILVRTDGKGTFVITEDWPRFKIYTDEVKTSTYIAYLYHKGEEVAEIAFNYFTELDSFSKELNKEFNDIEEN
jgi:hypothetical protein